MHITEWNNTGTMLFSYHTRTSATVLAVLAGFLQLLIVPCVSLPRSRRPILKEDRPRGPGTNRIRYSQSRPSPSDDFPVEVPVFPAYDLHSYPSESDLNPQRLRKILGTDYDAAFMSSVRPLESVLQPNGTLVYDFKNGRPRGRMPPHLKTISRKLPGRAKFHYQKLAKLRRYLWTYSYCPVHYHWKDLGGKFWPRWIRQGQCYRERSCSIPPGMTCKVKHSSTKTVLLWHCRTTPCTWIRIKFPVITECACSC
jgi:noggin